MFSALRQGSPLYILDKGNLTLKVGNVESTTMPTGMNNLPWLQMQQPMDATVRYEDGTTNEFKQLQPNTAVAVYGNVVVTETKELMAQEVESMARQSKQVLDSTAYHQKVMEACEGMKALLSPQFAKEKETEMRLTSLEQGLGDIKELLVKMSGGVSSAK